MLIFRAGNSQNACRNSKQGKTLRSSLILDWAACVCLFDRQLVFEILEKSGGFSLNMVFRRAVVTEHSDMQFLKIDLEIELLHITITFLPGLDYLPSPHLRSRKT